MSPVYACCHNVIINHTPFNSQTCYFVCQISGDLFVCFLVLSFLSTGLLLFKIHILCVSFPSRQVLVWPSSSPFAPILKVLFFWTCGGIHAANGHFLVKPTLYFLGSVSCLLEIPSCLVGFLLLRLHGLHFPWASMLLGHTFMGWWSFSDPISVTAIIKLLWDCLPVL